MSLFNVTFLGEKRSFLIFFIICSFIFSAATAYLYSSEKFIPKSDLIRRTLAIIEEKYVDQNRINPSEMFVEALNNLSAELIPVITYIEKTGDKIVATILIDENQQIFTFQAINNLNALETGLQQVLQFVKKNINAEDVNTTKEVDYALISGFLSTLDPHTNLLEPDSYSNFNAQTHGSFGGVGMLIGFKNGELTVLSPTADGPASKVGIQSNDRMVQINDESTVNMSTQEAVNLLRGEPGSEVQVHIMRENLTQPKSYTIIRDIITVQSVDSTVISEKEHRIGYIKIKKFSEKTADELDKSLNEMSYNLRDFKGIVVDLRNNPGGLLQQAIRISDRFLDSGSIVYIASADNKTTKKYQARPYGALTSTPLIILINNGSASASEIVSAALKKNRRAVILGEHTYGKGSVQVLLEQRDGAALKMTVSQYLTPGKASIQLVGVAPDVKLTPYYMTQEFFRLSSPQRHLGEEDLKKNFKGWAGEYEPEKIRLHHLHEDKSTQIDNAKKFNGGINLAELENDYAFHVAKQILLNYENPNYETLLQNTLDFSGTEEEIQKEKLIQKMKTFDIRWEEKQNTENYEFDSKIWFETLKKDGSNDIWERQESNELANALSTRLYLEIHNSSPIEIPQLTAEISSDERYFNNRQFIFGNILPGETKKWYVPFILSKSDNARIIPLKFIFKSDSKELDTTAEQELVIKQQIYPKYKYSIVLFDDGSKLSQGNNDGLQQLDETITLGVTLKNIGTVSSGKINIALKNGEKEAIFLKQGRKSIDLLAPGEEKNVLMNYIVKKIPKDGNIDLLLEIFDSQYPSLFIREKLKLSVNQKISFPPNTPPIIHIPTASLTTSMKKYTLNGTIIDDVAVKDLYVFLNNKKIYYKNITHNKTQKKEVEFNLQIDLKDGPNTLVVISRDLPRGISSREIIHIRKTVE